MKRLTVLGVTGSVGRRTLELVEHFPEDFRVEGMAARGSNPELVAELLSSPVPLLGCSARTFIARSTGSRGRRPERAAAS